MEHREEMNCGGDLCKEMLELDKLLRASDSEEMMGGKISIGITIDGTKEKNI